MKPARPPSLPSKGAVAATAPSAEKGAVGSMGQSRDQLAHKVHLAGYTALPAAEWDLLMALSKPLWLRS